MMKKYRLENVFETHGGLVHATLVTEYKFLWWSKVTRRYVFREKYHAHFIFLSDGTFTHGHTVEMLYRAHKAQESLAKGSE